MDLYSADLLSLDAKITLNTSEYNKKISEAVQKANEVTNTLKNISNIRLGVSNRNSSGDGTIFDSLLSIFCRKSR